MHHEMHEAFEQKVRTFFVSVQQEFWNVAEVFLSSAHRVKQSRSSWPWLQAVSQPETRYEWAPILCPDWVRMATIKYLEARNCEPPLW
jgi:hypothetical protein